VGPSSPNAELRGVARNGRPLVLIVDDNARNLKLAEDVLRADGLQTLGASTGAEAIAVALDRLPDVILLDLRLPDIDGVDVLRELKARERTAGVPVVALTAARLSDDEWIRAVGFSGSLEKPITVRDFPGQVRGYMQSRPA
jgi:two-component system, cell cycle response regulator DivK